MISINLRSALPSFFVLAYLAFPVRAEEATFPFEVRLTNVSGPVTVETADGKTKGPPPLYTPFSLQEGDFITTGSSATVDISFAGGTLIRLNSKSALKMVKLSDPETVLMLKSGVLLAKVEFDKASGQTFRVTTPSAIVTVKGTEFVIEESGAFARVGVLNEGHVAVTAKGFKKEVLMHFNQETYVPRGLSPRDAQVIERLYRYKVPMADMRQRVKIIRNLWKTLSPEEREKVRTEWISKNPAPARRSRSAAR